MIVRGDESFLKSFNNIPGGIKRTLIPILRKINMRLENADHASELVSEFDIAIEKSTEGIEGFEPGDQLYSIRLIHNYYLYLITFGREIPICVLCNIWEFPAR